MDGYDDVLQFISKVGDQNLNYRSFPADTQFSGQSKWHLLNQVASYKQQTVERQSERVVILNKGEPSRPDGSAYAFANDKPVFTDTPAQIAAQTEQPYPQVSLPQTQPKNSLAKGFSHLFKDPQAQKPQEKTARSDSLSALFSRIGS